MREFAWSSVWLYATHFLVPVAFAQSPAGKGSADVIFSVRARYRSTVHVPLDRIGKPEHYVIAYNEVYTNTSLKKTSPLLNQDVTYGALGSRFGQHWAVEVGYQFRYAPDSLEVNGPEDDSYNPSTLHSPFPVPG